MVVDAVLNMPKVRSVCILSFANPCQLQQVNSNTMIIELCSSGSRPSKTGMKH